MTQKGDDGQELPTEEPLLDPEQLATIESSLEVVKARGLDELTRRFYTGLFSQRPDLKPLFGDVEGQARKLAIAVTAIRIHLFTPSTMDKFIGRLAKSHQQLPIGEQDYAQFGSILAGAIADVAAESPAERGEIARTWATATRLISDALLKRLRRTHAGDTP